MSYEHVDQQFTLVIAWHDPLLHMKYPYELILSNVLDIKCILARSQNRNEFYCI
jgi:hypothetical protein